MARHTPRTAARGAYGSCALVLALVGASWSAAAPSWAAPASHLRLYTGEDGLSQLSVSAITQTPDGALWFGTWSGLNRFDGRHFRAYALADGLPHSRVHSLVVDREGTLWVATHGGLARRTATGFETVPTGFSSDLAQIHAVHADPDGTLWVGGLGGLVLLESERVVRGPLPEFGAVRAICADHEGRKWLATATGVWRSHGAHVGTSFEHVEPGPGTDVLVALPDGRVIGGGRRGVTIFADGRPASTLDADDAGRRVQVRALAVDAMGTVSVGTYAGLLELRSDRLVAVHREIEDTPIRILDSLFHDREGSLWIGGFGGIVRLAGLAFVNHRERDGLPSSNVRPVLRGPEGDLWAGTLGGLGRYDGRTWRTYDVTDGLGHSLVLSLLLDSRGRLWIGHQRGLDLFGEGRFVRRESWPLDVPVHHLAEDAAGNVWAVSSSRGLWIVEGEQLRATKKDFPGGTGLNCRLLRARNGDMWMSSRAGLCRYREGQWTVFTTADGLASPEPYFLAEDQQGSIWFGYQDAAGITRYDGASFRTWTQADGLAHDAVYSIGCDAEGELWIGSARGVDRFDGTTFRNYSPRDGFASSESNAGGFFADADGRLWFGTARGLSEYRPWLDRALGVPLLAAIEWIRLGDQPVTGPVRVAHDTNTLTAWTSVYSSVDPGSMQVEYRIAGLDEDWTPTARGELRVPNLPSGTFALELRARRYAEPWTVVRSAEFTVSPPYWASWPFLLGTTVLLAGSITLVFRWNTRRVRAHNLHLQRAVAERTRELTSANEELVRANAAKNAFMANVSHEIRTPMNAILGMTELVLDSPLGAEQRERLLMVQSSGEHLLQLVNDILDVSKIEAGRLELVAHDVELAPVIGSIVHELADSAHQKELRLEYALDASLPRQARIDDLRLRQIFMNLIGNAIKFTAAGHVVVRARGGERIDPAHVRLHFSVCDSGIGIAEDRIEAIFESFTQEDASTTRRYGGTGLGLTITRELVGLLGGSIHARSARGRGSCFEFDIVAAAEHRDPAITVPHPLHALRVVLAEADPVCAATIADKLAPCARSVRTIASGDELMGLALELRPDDVVLLDPRLPGARRALAALASAPSQVIVMSAAGDPGEPDLRTHPAVAGMLPRPVCPEALAALVRRPGASRSARPDAAAAQVPAARRSLRVLVAEDNDVNQKLAVAMLERLGHHAVVAADGAKAVALFEHETFDVVLMDMQMPEMDGLQATRAIRALEARRGGHVPVIALTANAMVGDRDRCLAAGMDDYLSKPIRRAALDQALQRVDRTGLQPIGPV